jgi:hypothetical protein
MAIFSVSAVILLAAMTGAGGEKTLVGTFQTDADLAPQGKIDELVFAKLRQLDIPPAHLCSDEVFLRRVYLDVIGTLPTAQEARQFLSDRDSGKRRALIDRLLERDEFADYWAMKWSDLLRLKAEFPINLWPNAAQAYHRWIRTSIKQNMPYDRFVRELLTASGSNFRRPPVNFYRALQSRQPEAIAQAVALTFMGSRAENWPGQRLAGMAAFFSQIGYKSTAEWKEEIVLFDPDKLFDAEKLADPDKPRNSDKVPNTGKTTPPADGKPLTALFPDGTPANLSADRDPREIFADWLIDAKNPWFARNIVNRVWSWLLGRGIIHEPDDIRSDNPPQNAELLAFLEEDLVAAHYDLKHICRLILNSKTYQLSSIAQGTNAEAAANFAQYPLRRLEAEVLIDALDQITGTTEAYSSAIPEPFTWVPEEQRSIALADASVTSPFLEMFGRSPRDTGLESERNNRTTAAQRLHMLNSSHVLRKIEQSPKLQSLSRFRGNPHELVAGLYLTILSRFPTEEELKIIDAYVQSGSVNPRDISVDVAWALINSTEFLYRH